MFTKRIAFIVFICLFLSVFTACGNSGAESSTPSPEPTPSPSPVIESTPEPTPEPTPTPPTETVELNETSIVLTEKGEVFDLYCGSVPIENVSWFCDDESVAIFSQGKAVAINKGTTTIHAVFQDQTASCEVICDVDPESPMHSIDDSILHAPRLAPPVVDMEDTSFFADAAFMGDSVSYVLQRWHMKTGAFGDATFLVRSSIGLQNSLDGRITINYQSADYSPEDILQKTGVKKVFIMLGLNDIGLFGVDGTMERWELFIDRIEEKCPELEIYIQSCTPIYYAAEYPGYNNALFDEYNSRLKIFCEDRGLNFVDIAPYFKDFSNGMATIYSSDKSVHMTYEGTAVWERVLKAYVAELTKGENQ